MSAVEMDVYTTPALAGEIGVTYRELDYWVSQGFLSTTALNGGEDRRNPGTGKARVWVGRDVEVARLFAALVKGGIKPRSAGEMAIALAGGGAATVAPGIEIRAIAAVDSDPR